MAQRTNRRKSLSQFALLRPSVGLDCLQYLAERVAAVRILLSLHPCLPLLLSEGCFSPCELADYYLGNMSLRRRKGVSPYQEHDCWQRRVQAELDMAYRLRKSTHSPTKPSSREPFTQLRKRKGLSFSADLHELLASSVNTKQSSPARRVCMGEEAVRMRASNIMLGVGAHIPCNEHSPYLSQFAAAHYLKPNQRAQEAPELSSVLEAIRLDSQLSAVEKSNRQQSYLRRAREQLGSTNGS